LKSLEVSEEKANQRVEEFKRQLKTLTVKLKEAENRAELAEKTVKKLQKEVDRLEGIYAIPTGLVFQSTTCFRNIYSLLFFLFFLFNEFFYHIYIFYH
jgi:multidrug resistance efflux pump